MTTDYGGATVATPKSFEEARVWTTSKNMHRNSVNNSNLVGRAAKLINIEEGFSQLLTRFIQLERYHKRKITSNQESLYTSPTRQSMQFNADVLGRGANHRQTKEPGLSLAPSEEVRGQLEEEESDWL
jgi:hypothetical protein